MNEIITNNNINTFNRIFTKWYINTTKNELDTSLIKRLMNASLKELNNMIFIGCEIVRLKKNTKYYYTGQKNRTKLQLIALLLNLFEKNKDLLLTEKGNNYIILQKGE